MTTTTSMRGRLETPNSVVEYITAGHGTITLQSQKTGTRFTYRFAMPDALPAKSRPVFVRLLTGSDNSSSGSYTFLGTIFIRQDNSMDYKPGKKSPISPYAPSSVAISWLIRVLLQSDAEQQLSKVRVWHEGTCCCCGRKLTDPESIASGIGPTCAGKNYR